MSSTPDSEASAGTPHYEDYIDKFLSIPGSKVAFIGGDSGSGKSVVVVPDLWKRCHDRNLTLICLQPSKATSKAVCQAFQALPDKAEDPDWMEAYPTCHNVQFGYNKESSKAQHYVGRDFCHTYKDLAHLSASGCTELALVFDNMAPAQTHWDVICFEQLRLWMETLRGGGSNGLSLTVFVMVSYPMENAEVVPYEDFPDHHRMDWTSGPRPSFEGFELDREYQGVEWKHTPAVQRNIRRACKESSSVVCLASYATSRFLRDKFNSPNSTAGISAIHREEGAQEEDILHERVLVDKKPKEVLLADDEMRFVERLPDACDLIICFARVRQWRQDGRGKRFMRVDTVSHVKDLRWAIRLAYMASRTEGRPFPKVLFEKPRQEKYAGVLATDLRCCLLTMVFLVMAWWPGKDPGTIPILDRLYHPAVLTEMIGRLRIIGAVPGKRLTGPRNVAIVAERAFEADRILRELAEEVPNLEFQTAWFLAGIRGTTDRNVKRIMVRMAAIMLLKDPNELIERSDASALDRKGMQQICDELSPTLSELPAYGTPWLILAILETIRPRGEEAFPVDHDMVRQDIFWGGKIHLRKRTYDSYVHCLSILERKLEVAGDITWSGIAPTVTGLCRDISQMILESHLHNLISVTKKGDHELEIIEAVCETPMERMGFIDPSDVMASGPGGEVHVLAVFLHCQSTENEDGTRDYYVYNLLRVEEPMLKEVEKRTKLDIGFALCTLLL